MRVLLLNYTTIFYVCILYPHYHESGFLFLLALLLERIYKVNIVLYVFITDVPVNKDEMQHTTVQ